MRIFGDGDTVARASGTVKPSPFHPLKNFGEIFDKYKNLYFVSSYNGVGFSSVRCGHNCMGMMVRNDFSKDCCECIPVLDALYICMVCRVRAKARKMK